MLPVLLSESLLLAPPLLSHAARERTSSAESRKDMNFFILITSSAFEKHCETCGNFSENGEIYIYKIIYITSIVWSAFF